MVVEIQERFGKWWFNESICVTKRDCANQIHRLHWPLDNDSTFNYMDINF